MGTKNGSWTEHVRIKITERMKAYTGKGAKTVLVWSSVFPVASSVYDHVDKLNGCCMRDMSVAFAKSSFSCH